MPLTNFQSEVLAVIVGNRSEQSHFAGGLVLNANDESARFSNDFDMFHDAIADLEQHSLRDVAALEAAGYEVEKALKYSDWSKPESFRKALVRRNGEKVALDWAHDSAFRFFPIVPDSQLGWRLHLFLLKMMKRFAKLDPLKMEEIRARELKPIEMKMEWITISDKAETEIIKLADTVIDMPIGVAFVNEKGEPGWIGDNPDLKIHYGSLRGCWPTISAVEEGS